MAGQIGIDIFIELYRPIMQAHDAYTGAAQYSLQPEAGFERQTDQKGSSHEISF
jgi:hypothetical protein